MLQRQNRLTQKSDFQKVLKEGQKIPGRFFILVCLKEESKDAPKIGIIVSNKISKSSVVRNKIKRYAREATRQDIKNIQNGASVVLISKRSAIEATQDTVSKDLTTIFKRAKLYR